MRQQECSPDGLYENGSPESMAVPLAGEFGAGCTVEGAPAQKRALPRVGA